MHKIKKYYFINKFDSNNIDRQKINTGIIYRNYDSKNNLSTVIKLKQYCKKKGYKFFLSNNVKLALNLNPDGAYIPSFNNERNHLSFSFKKKFLIIGSAHNNKEIKRKELQKVDLIFIASLFNRKKTYLGLNRFLILTKLTKKKIIALGGINNKNIKILNLLNIYGYSGISLFNPKKNGPQKIEGR